MFPRYYRKFVHEHDKLYMYSRLYVGCFNRVSLCHATQYCGSVLIRAFQMPGRNLPEPVSL